MSEITDNEDLVVPDELTTLKARADVLGIKYHPSISLEKLREKVNTSLEGADTGSDATEDTAVEAAEETKEQRRARKRKEANTLVRIRVACMNPAKKEWEGELITAGNSLVGSFSKFVPFNVDDGWHVPNIVYQQMEQRQCQIFVTKKDNLGNNVRKGKLIKEFNIEILPQLTQKELDELARRQAMANNTSD